MLDGTRRLLDLNAQGFVTNAYLNGPAANEVLVLDVTESGATTSVWAFTDLRGSFRSLATVDAAGWHLLHRDFDDRGFVEQEIPSASHRNLSRNRQTQMNLASAVTDVETRWAEGAAIYMKCAKARVDPQQTEEHEWGWVFHFVPVDDDCAASKTCACAYDKDTQKIAAVGTRGVEFTLRQLRTQA